MIPMVLAFETYHSVSLVPSEMCFGSMNRCSLFERWSERRQCDTPARSVQLGKRRLGQFRFSGCVCWNIHRQGCVVLGAAVMCAAVCCDEHDSCAHVIIAQDMANDIIYGVNLLELGVRTKQGTVVAADV